MNAAGQPIVVGCAVARLLYQQPQAIKQSADESRKPLEFKECESTIGQVPNFVGGMDASALVPIGLRSIQAGFREVRFLPYALGSPCGDH